MQHKSSGWAVVAMIQSVSSLTNLSRASDTFIIIRIFLKAYCLPVDCPLSSLSSFYLRLNVSNLLEILTRSVLILKVDSFTILICNNTSGCTDFYHCKKATTHQVTTMLATSKNVLFPDPNRLLTTSTDDWR